MATLKDRAMLSPTYLYSLMPTLSTPIFYFLHILSFSSSPKHTAFSQVFLHCWSQQAFTNPNTRVSVMVLLSKLGLTLKSMIMVKAI